MKLFIIRDAHGAWVCYVAALAAADALTKVREAIARGLRAPRAEPLSAEAA